MNAGGGCSRVCAANCNFVVRAVPLSRVCAFDDSSGSILRQ